MGIHRSNNQNSGVHSIMRSLQIDKTQLQVHGNSIKLSKDLLDYDKGGGVYIDLPCGYQGNPGELDGAHILIEFYEGELRVCVWNGDENPNITVMKPIGDCNNCEQNPNECIYQEC